MKLTRKRFCKICNAMTEHLTTYKSAKLYLEEMDFQINHVCVAHDTEAARQLLSSETEKIATMAHIPSNQLQLGFSA